MSGPLLLGIAGLALLDSLNPATIIAVVLILIAAPRRPGLVAGPPCSARPSPSSASAPPCS